MTSKIEEGILTAISFVPGLVGLATINFEKKATILNEKDWAKGITFENAKNGVLVKVSAIISKDIRAKLVSNEISSSVKSVIEKNNMELEGVLVYIRGVK